MLETRLAHGWLYPVGVWLIVLVVVFATEYVVMLLLPWLLPLYTSRFLESVLDAVILTLFLAPVLWWTLVRPLREVFTMHDDLTYARAALAAGATGYVVKTVSEEDLLAALRAVTTRRAQRASSGRGARRRCVARPERPSG